MRLVHRSALDPAAQELLLRSGQDEIHRAIAGNGSLAPQTLLHDPGHAIAGQARRRLLTGMAELW